MRKRLNLKRLVEDLGGATEVARRLRHARTTPYGWIRRGAISSRTIEQIKECWPYIDIDYYFEDVVE